MSLYEADIRDWAHDGLRMIYPPLYRGDFRVSFSIKMNLKGKKACVGPRVTDPSPSQPLLAARRQKNATARVLA